MTRSTPARILSLTTALAALLLGGVQPASAHGDDPGALNPQARKAGLTHAQGGTMGWRAPASSERTPAPQTAAASVPGIDVSGYQGNVDWASYWGQGKRFAYTKATEGSYYTNDYFSQQYNGSYNQGFIRGAYHFANPSDSSGATQATYFVNHGGGWSGDGKTLPGALDIEYNPYDGGTCYGLTSTQMVSWIADFTSTYQALTGRDAVIYSTTDWWSTCTGNTTAFSATNPLWVARYSSTVGTLPGGWGYYTFWQYSSSPVDQDTFNGDLSRLTALATG